MLAKSLSSLCKYLVMDVIILEIINYEFRHIGIQKFNKIDYMVDAD